MFVSSIFALILLAASIESVVVQTQYGFIRGITNTTETGTVFYNFFGIPYARPPIGTLRFRVNIYF